MKSSSRGELRPFLAFAITLTLLITGAPLANAATATITYSANSTQHQEGVVTGSVPSPETKNTGNVVVAANSGNLERQGFIFAGWNTLANGSGTTYAAGTGTYNLTTNVTLYAKWDIPASARLIGAGGSIITINNNDNRTNGADCMSGGIRGITSDGSAIYFRTSGKATLLCKADFSGKIIRADLVTGLTNAEQLDLTYSSGCVFIRTADVYNTLTCIDVTTTSNWTLSTKNLPTGKDFFVGSTWLFGNLIDFPDGRVGAVSGAPSTLGALPSGTVGGSCPSNMYCKVIRLFNVANTGTNFSLTFSEDIVLADPDAGWPSDEHGIATDGTYLYEIHHASGYKVWGLRSGQPSYLVFNGAVTGATSCGASTGVSGTLCTITYPINGVSGSVAASTALTNSTFFGRVHATGKYIMGDYGGAKFYISDSGTPPIGPGTLDTTAPTFNTPYSANFAENTSATTTAATVSVSESATISIAAGGDGALFSVTKVDSASAVLKFLTSPNFESASDSGANNVYDINVTARDSKGNTGSQTYSITVTNVNEAPLITNSSSDPTSAISRSENSTSVVDLDGSDVDASTTLSWSISGTDSAKFAINSSSGVLTFTSAPNFESATDADGNNSYIVIAAVSDGTLTDTQTITVTITNVNEAPVIGAFTSAATASYSVAEGATSLVNMNGTDEDANPSLSYSLTGSDAAQFSITAGGVLSFASARNYENALDADQNNSYVVTVELSDGALTDTQTLTITVTDSNEAPTITINLSGATHAISIAENSTAVITYTATDVDSGSMLSWSISGTDSTFFTINSSTGALTFIAAPDYEVAEDAGNNNTYIVIVTVSDGALTDAQTLTVTITNVNEAGTISAPSVSGTAYKGITITITITTNAPGKVRFLVGGKRVANCLARPTTGNSPTYTATCAWKPTIHGPQQLSAQLTPSNLTFTSATSAKSVIWVYRRSSPR